MRKPRSATRNGHKHPTPEELRNWVLIHPDMSMVNPNSTPSAQALREFVPFGVAVSATTLEKWAVPNSNAVLMHNGARKSCIHPTKES